MFIEDNIFYASPDEFAKIRKLAGEITMANDDEVVINDKYRVPLAKLQELLDVGLHINFNMYVMPKPKTISELEKLFKNKKISPFEVVALAKNIVPTLKMSDKKKFEQIYDALPTEMQGGFVQILTFQQKCMMPRFLNFSTEQWAVLLLKSFHINNSANDHVLQHIDEVSDEMLLSLLNKFKGATSPILTGEIIKRELKPRDKKTLKSILCLTYFHQDYLYQVFNHIGLDICVQAYIETNNALLKKYIDENSAQLTESMKMDILLSCLL